MRVFSTETDKPIENVSVGGNWLAASNWSYRRDGLVIVWSISKLEASIPSRQFIGSETVIIDSFGRLIYSPEAFGVKVIDLENKITRPAPKIQLRSPQISLSPHNGLFVVRSSFNQSGAFDVFRLQSDGSFLPLWAHQAQEYVHYTRPTTSPDGQMLAYEERVMFVNNDLNNVDCFVHLAENKAPLAKITLPDANQIRALAVSNQGHLFSLSTRLIRIFDISTSKELSIIRCPHRRQFRAFTIHPNSRWLVTGDTGGIIRYWDIETFTEVLALDWQQGPIESLAFSPDGLMGAAGTRTGRVVVWDVDL